MQPRTKRQKEILEYISNFIDTRGYKPSYQQIALHFRLASKAAVAKHISALEKQGLISRRRENGSFSLELYPKKTDTDLVSQVDWLALPDNLKATDDLADETILVPTFLLGFNKPEKLRAFRVQNDAMVDEHICEGDIVFLEERSFARDGDLVVAVVGEEKVAFKRFYRAGANIELVASNPQIETVVVDADEVEVKGVYRGLLRPLI